MIFSLLIKGCYIPLQTFQPYEQVSCQKTKNKLPDENQRGITHYKRQNRHIQRQYSANTLRRIARKTIVLATEKRVATIKRLHLETTKRERK